MNKEKVVVTGRVLDKNYLVGLKVYRLSDIKFIFVKKSDFNILFEDSDVIHCKLIGNSIKYIDIKANDLEILDIKGNSISCGRYSDEVILTKYLNIEREELIIKRCGALVSGAITNLYSDEADKHANLYYQEIRSFTSDIKRISKNINKSEDEIKRVKDYLFYSGYYIDANGNKKYFDSDFAIAQSWQRLMSKKKSDIKPHDITLINHELLEMQYKDKGYSHDKAHALASSKYNYDKEAKEYYKSLEENNDRIN